jgi:hypothetical protein
MYTLVGIIATQVPHKDMSWPMLIKIQLVVFVLTSLFSQVDIRQKTDNTFSSNWNEGMSFFSGAMLLLTIGFIVVGLIHAFLTFDTFFITNYLFGYLIGTTAVTFMSRIYFLESAEQGFSLNHCGYPSGPGSGSEYLGKVINLDT